MDGQPYIVQELIDGRNLDRWEREQSPDHRTVVRLLIEIAEALGYAHEQGFVHQLGSALRARKSTGKPSINLLARHLLLCCTAREDRRELLAAFLLARFLAAVDLHLRVAIGGFS